MYMPETLYEELPSKDLMPIKLHIASLPENKDKPHFESYNKLIKDWYNKKQAKDRRRKKAFGPKSMAGEAGERTPLGSPDLQSTPTKTASQIQNEQYLQLFGVEDYFEIEQQKKKAVLPNVDKNQRRESVVLLPGKQSPRA